MKERSKQIANKQSELDADKRKAMEKTPTVLKLVFCPNDPSNNPTNSN
jgi:hypothetical protein